MANVLITALGTGRRIRKQLSDGTMVADSKREYEKTTYIIDEEEYNTDLVADALIRHYHIDRVYLIGTARSAWEQVYFDYSADCRDEEYFINLQDIAISSSHDDYKFEEGYLQPVEKAIDKRLNSSGSRCLLVKYGLNDKELEYNFNKLKEIVDQLQPGDRVYVDITHSFRSLAIFQFVMSSFIENLMGKQIAIAKILYGMLDITPEMNGKAIVVDLTYINKLNKWIRGIYELENYGNGYLVADLLRAMPDQQINGCNIKDLSDRININYLRNIRDEQGKASWSHLGHVDGPGRFATDNIKQFLRTFGGNEPESTFELKVARWHFEKKRFAEGYITLVEAIVTRLCEVTGRDLTKPDLTAKDIQKLRREAKRFIGKKDDYLHGLGELLAKVNNIRRDIAHFQGGDEKEYRDAVDKCLKYCQNAEKMFKLVGAEFLK